MHPIERLRYVARAGGVDQALLTREAAGALASLGMDPAGLVTSCRRLVGKHPRAGALWTLAARVLTSTEPMQAAWELTEDLDSDPTARELASALPDDATIVIVGWSDTIPAALVRRGDVRVLVVDQFGDGNGLVRQLDDRDVDAHDVPSWGLGSAVASADVVVLEAAIAGDGGIVAPAGSLAAAATARAIGAEVWAVVPVGRALPSPMWRYASAPLGGPDPWNLEDEVVPVELIDAMIGPTGKRPGDELRLRTDCVVAPELLKPVI